jgi:hypothetical protein
MAASECRRAIDMIIEQGKLASVGKGCKGSLFLSSQCRVKSYSRVRFFPAVDLLLLTGSGELRPFLFFVGVLLLEAS